MPDLSDINKFVLTTAHTPGAEITTPSSCLEFGTTLGMWEVFRHEGIRAPCPVRELPINRGALPAESIVQASADGA